MNIQYRTPLFLALALALLVVPTAEAGKPGTGGKGGGTSYAGVILGVLPNDSNSWGTAVSDVGAVVGWSSHDVSGRPFYRAFYWDNTTKSMYQLPDSDGATDGVNQTMALAIATVNGAERAAGSQTKPGKVGHAAVWTSLPTGRATLLDESTESSRAEGINAAGTVVGSLGAYAAIWMPTSSGYSVATFRFFPSNCSNPMTRAAGVNLEGVVVGHNWLDGCPQELAFLRNTNGDLFELDPLPGDVHAHAQSVSDVFSSQDKQLVYVSGFSESASGSQRAVRWTFNLNDGTVLETLTLKSGWCAATNNAGDLACTMMQTGRQRASLYRNGAYIALNAPKAFTQAASRGISRTAGTTTFVTGLAVDSTSTRAVLWEIK